MHAQPVVPGRQTAGKSDAVEAFESFPCFGAVCAAYVTGEAHGASAELAAASIKSRLLAWHKRFTRFESTSELSALNADPRPTVPASTTMRHFVRAVLYAARMSGGLVDATLLGAVRDVGYRHDVGAPLPLALALRLAPPRRRAGRSSRSRWREITVDDAHGTITRPAGVMFDSGGLAKGLFADLIASEVAEHASFAINCAGDLRVGGAAGIVRAVNVQSPFDHRVLHTFQLSDAGVATSGIGKRSWLDGNLSPAHHLLDPGTGRPAYTGIVQATALAPSALEAEVRAKAALLSGPASAPAWLSGGGVLVFDNGSHEVLAARKHDGGSANV